ncbi:hypothetical protein LEMLEM_LOCUS7661 [Lemmus lemmus]
MGDSLFLWYIILLLEDGEWRCKVREDESWTLFHNLHICPCRRVERK